MTTQNMNPLNVPTRKDPVLAELWKVKARLNAQAGYDVKRLLEKARETTARIFSNTNTK